VIYLLWRRRHKKYHLSATHAPTIILENSSVLPASFPTDDASEIPTIRYVKPPEVDVELTPRRTSSKKLRKKQNSEKFPRDIELRNRSTHVKRKPNSASRVPSCYPIGEYTGPLSDQEGDIYDKIASPSNSGRRRSMSVSDLSSLNDKDAQLHVPSLLSRLHAKRERHYQPSKPSSAPIEMDEDMTDLYDSTLKSPRSKSYNAAQPPAIRLSGLDISLAHEPTGNKRTHNSRPVTKYENSEIIQMLRESINPETPEQAIAKTQQPQVKEQPSTLRLSVPQFKKEEESPYVTMRSVTSSKQSLLNFSYLNTKPSKTNKSNSFPENDIPPIELNTLSAQTAKTNSLHDKPMEDSVPIEINGLDALTPPVNAAIQPVPDSKA